MLKYSGSSVITRDIRTMKITLLYQGSSLMMIVQCNMIATTYENQPKAISVALCVTCLKCENTIVTYYVIRT